ncbi:MAG: hypothetical protein HUJ94_05620, partial [Bacteroidales bacterium]|nr:hypothetical protein [Bacteroidales bacterium]
MKINRIFLLSSMVAMAVACENQIEGDNTQDTTTVIGQEVDFGGQLEGTPGTKTIYGSEEGAGTNNWSFPILWLKEDKVFIASPQCREDFTSGTFGVPSNADHHNYAGSFIKESGAVQWGSEDADFYAIYPQRTGEYA